MTNLESREKLFHLAEKFTYGIVNADDLKELGALLLYNPPYTSRIVFPTSPDDLKFVCNEEMIDDDPDNAGGYSHAGQEIKLYSNTFLDEKFPFYFQFVRFLETMGHEYTHFLQDLAKKATFENPVVKNVVQNYRPLNLSPQAQKVIDTFSRLDTERNLSEMILYSRKGMFNRVDLDDANYWAYLQLLHEENARDCQFVYANEILNSMLNDELCTKDVKRFLKKCQKWLNEQWRIELKGRNSHAYKQSRKLLDQALEDLSKLDIKTISLTGESLRENLIANKLFAMRKAGCDKFEYYKTAKVLQGGFDEACANYLLGVDQKEMLLRFLHCEEMRPEIALHIFADTDVIFQGKKPTLLSAEEISTVYGDWAGEGRFDLLDSSFKATEKDYSLKMEHLDDKRKEAIRKAVFTNEKLWSKVHEAFVILGEIAERGEILSEEEFNLVQKRFYIVSLETQFSNYIDNNAEEAAFNQLLEKLSKPFDDYFQKKISSQQVS